MESCAQGNDFNDWWWKARLGKCYYQLGLMRDAELQFESSLKNQEMISTVQELCKIYLRIDQPNTALESYTAALQVHGEGMGWSRAGGWVPRGREGRGH